MKKTTITLIAVGTVLLLALALQAMRIRNIKDGQEGGGVAAGLLAKRLPMSVGAWTGHDEPLGENELVRSATEKILNFDDYVNRRYERAGVVFGVYVAYWRPERLPVQKVASHTPDRCWSENGWTCEQMRFGITLENNGVKLKPAQWRIFNPPGDPQRREYVIYWHLVGDEVYDYGNRFNQRPSFYKWWRDSLAYAIKGSQEQYFIRLTSNRPIEEIWNDPDVQQIIGDLAKVGLIADSEKMKAEGTPVASSG